jgi:Protein of unknown function (DUF2771)
VVLSSPRALGAGAALALLAPLAAGCGSGTPAPPSVTIAIGDRTVQLRPTQYCTGGQLHRYTTTPPVIAAPPATRVLLTVPAAVARQGWAVQVFDDQLKTQIGQVEAGKATTFDKITTSDPAPPGFYLVVAERGGSSACQGLAGAWPVGVIRAGAPAGGSASAPPTGG